MRQITNQTKTRFSWLQSYGLAFTLLFYASHAWAQNTKIDFDKYANETDLRLTMEQQIMMYKYKVFLK